MIRTGISTIALALLLAGPAGAQEKKASPVASGAATPAAADAFVKRAADEFDAFSKDDARIQWLYATYINDDTSALVAKSQAQGTEMAVRFALEAAKYDKVKARHILIRTPGSRAPVRQGQKELTEPQAKAKVEAIRKRLVDGKEDFAAVAKAESDDAGSGAQGPRARHRTERRRRLAARAQQLGSARRPRRGRRRAQAQQAHQG